MTTAPPPGEMKLVFTAQSKREFYCRDAVCEYVLRQGAVPLNPFRVFDYFLSERVDRSQVREANSYLISRCDEVWSFGTRVADGVLGELRLAGSLKKPIRVFSIAANANEIAPIRVGTLRFEPEVYSAGGRKDALLAELSRVVVGELS